MSTNKRNSNINLGSGENMFDLFAAHVRVALYIPILLSFISFFFSALVELEVGGLSLWFWYSTFHRWKWPAVAQRHTMHPDNRHQIANGCTFFPRALVSYLIWPSRGHIALATDLMASAFLPQRAACTVHMVNKFLACFYDEWCPYNPHCEWEDKKFYWWKTRP